MDNWFDELDDREKAQVHHATDYTARHSKAGVPGHGQFLLIAKLVRQLEERDQLLTAAHGKPVIQKLVRGDDGKWHDIYTGLLVDV